MELPYKKPKTVPAGIQNLFVRCVIIESELCLGRTSGCISHLPAGRSISNTDSVNDTLENTSSTLVL